MIGPNTPEIHAKNVAWRARKDAQLKQQKKDRRTTLILLPFALLSALALPVMAGIFIDQHPGYDYYHHNY